VLSKVMESELAPRSTSPSWRAWLLIALVVLSPFLIIGLAVAGMALASDPMAGT
jgi:hypothetical protein